MKALVLDRSWRYSDDTVMHHATAHALVHGRSLEDRCKRMAHQYKATWKDMSCVHTHQHNMEWGHPALVAHHVCCALLCCDLLCYAVLCSAVAQWSSTRQDHMQGGCTSA